MDGGVGVVVVAVAVAVAVVVVVVVVMRVVVVVEVVWEDEFAAARGLDDGVAAAGALLLGCGRECGRGPKRVMRGCVGGGGGCGGFGGCGGVGVHGCGGAGGRVGEELDHGLCVCVSVIGFD